MSNPASDTPAAFLRRLMESGVLRRGDVESAAGLLRSSSDSWYAKLVTERGVEQAERKLAEWLAARGDYADSVSSVASGLLALTALDDVRSIRDPRFEVLSPVVRLVPLTGTLYLPGAHDYSNGILILAENPHVSERGADVFGPSEGIHLRHVGIAVDQDLAEPTLFLFLRHPEYQSVRLYETRGYAVIAIDTEGCVSGMTVDFHLVADPVEFAFGLTRPNEAIYIGANIPSRTDTGVNMALRFPGSEEYLARHIGILGVYLENVAATLRNRHKR